MLIHSSFDTLPLAFTSPCGLPVLLIEPVIAAMMRGIGAAKATT